MYRLKEMKSLKTSNVNAQETGIGIGEWEIVDYYESVYKWQIE